MRDAMSQLRLKLAAAEEDTSCAALNRLRSKLRELTREGRRVDQQVLVERSTEMPTELCEDVRTENERLRAELTQLRQSLREVAVPVLEVEADAEALPSRLRNCEALLAESRARLDEKAARADALASDLDRMTADHRAMVVEMTAVKTELEKRDDKAFRFYPFLFDRSFRGRAENAYGIYI